MCTIDNIPSEYQSMNAICIIDSRKHLSTRQRTRSESREKEERVWVKRSERFSRHCGIAYGTQMIRARMLKSGSRFTGEKESERRAIFLKSDSHMCNFLKTSLAFFSAHIIRDDFSHECKSCLVSSIEREDPT